MSTPKGRLRDNRSVTQDQKVSFSGTIAVVKARIKLLRSFDQIPTHQYQGYTLVVKGELGGEAGETRVAVGPKAHEKFKFQIGDEVSGKAVPISNPKQEWSQYYKTSAIKVVSHGERTEPNPDGGLAPMLPEYRKNGHLRLSKTTANNKCTKCPWGLLMTTEMTIDQWAPSTKKYRIESHCYGPRDCPNYKPGKPYIVPGRKDWMKYEDDDYERFMSGEY